MTMLASQITSLTVVYSIVYSGVNQRKHQSSASLAFVWEIHRGPVNLPHKWPVTRKMFPCYPIQWLIFGRRHFFKYIPYKKMIGYNWVPYSLDICSMFMLFITEFSQGKMILYCKLRTHVLLVSINYLNTKLNMDIPLTICQLQFRE